MEDLGGLGAVVEDLGGLGGCSGRFRRARGL